MNRKGFTLIELLVVVAVLALLASIVFSNLGGAREGARISNALSFQSQTHSLLGADLIGWWNFNEELGSTAGDISGYDNHGTIYGATHVDGVPGTGGNALEFDGVDDYVAVVNSVSITEIQNYTFGAWLKIPNPGSNYDPFFFKQSGSASDIEIYGGNGGITIAHNRYNGGDFEYIYANNIPANEWVYYNVVYSSGTLKTYINGINDQNFTGFLDPLLHEYPIDIGKVATFVTDYLTGKIADVRIYSRALTAGEIQTLYTQTKGKYLAND